MFSPLLAGWQPWARHAGLLEGLQGMGDLLCVACRVNPVEACRDTSVGRDDEGVATGESHKPKIQQAVVCGGRMPAGIGQQGERQLVFTGKTGVRPGVVDADSGHRRVEIA